MIGNSDIQQLALDLQKLGENSERIAIFEGTPFASHPSGPALAKRPNRAVQRWLNATYDPSCIGWISEFNILACFG